MFGSHLSIAGSMSNALREAEALGMDTVQVFTKNQQQWKAPPLADEAVSEWKGEVARLGWQGRTVAHASYLINLASPDDTLWRRSIELMRVEIERCEALAIPFLVHHPGSSTGSGAPAGMARVVEAYQRLFADTRGFVTASCLENTVGAGSTLGGRFEELAALRARIVEATGTPDRIGFCFDTCHAHAAGYDFSTRKLGAEVLDLFDATCGLEHLRVVHVNDSKAPTGSRLDRHEHVGVGTIGRRGLADSGFAALLARPALRLVPKILETPKGLTKAGTPLDALNLRRLRKLLMGLEPIEGSRRARSGPVRSRRKARPATHA